MCASSDDRRLKVFSIFLDPFLAGTIWQRKPPFVGGFFCGASLISVRRSREIQLSQRTRENAPAASFRCGKTLPNLGCPLPCRSIGIIDLAAKPWKIHGLQSVAGKILSGKELAVEIWLDRLANSLASLDHAREFGELRSRFKVTAEGCGFSWFGYEIKIPTLSRKAREGWGTRFFLAPEVSA
jgi:hypothetical protein